MRRIIFPFAVILVFILSACTTLGSSYLSMNNNYFEILYQEQDKSIAETIYKLLNSNRSNIINEINPGFDKKVKVKIFPDLDSLNYARQAQGFPPAGIGGGNAIYSTNSIWMVSPNKPGGTISYGTAIVSLHEFTHLVIDDLNPKCATTEAWFIECLCYYEAGQKGGIRDAQDHVKWIDEGFFEHYDQRTYWNDHFFIAKFLKNTWGPDAFKKIIINNGSVEKAYNVNLITFYNLYRDWLSKQKY
jgi:hypothetical protein